MNVDSLWDFKEAVMNVRALRLEYEGVLTLFNCFNARIQKIYIKWLRDKIYALNIYEWQKDKLWEYLNDDIEYEILIGILNRQKVL